MNQEPSFFGWQSIGKHDTPDTRIAAAVERYAEKYAGATPRSVRCHLAEVPTQLPIGASGCRVDPDRHTARGIVLLEVP